MINRALLDDASKKTGSASSPVLIGIGNHDNSGRQDTSEEDDSDGDTVRLSTPEFYEILRDGGTTSPQKKFELTNSPLIVTLSKVYGQTFDFTCSPEPESTVSAHREEKRPELTGASEGKKMVLIRSGRKFFELTELTTEASKRKDECATLTVESRIASHGQPGVSRPGQDGVLEPSINIRHIANDSPPPSCQRGSVNPKRKLERKANPGVRRSKRLMREKI
ncbi:uncharacterized protein N7529_007089 [Penicillium soppii]|uniref:uncharacterized protein n=1 Tax=Penicillium soppii TaxID=69789 RepID=UPI0025497580|nr:uncharacterized protein N7529_007089 [Penicillium soppii]KAJ5865173.1 hypothetical protein N7529_007089 [Penicillium soppii]